MAEQRPIILLGVSDHELVPRDALGSATVTATAPDHHLTLEVLELPAASTGGMAHGAVELPTGGPYTLCATARDAEDRVVDRRYAAGVVVGDVWILAGQSQMQGSFAPDGTDEVVPQVVALGADGRWTVAHDPLHRLYACRDNALTRVFLCADPDATEDNWNANHLTDQVSPVGGTGPGVSFAQELWRRTGVPVGLLPCALGGSSLDMWADDWGLRQGQPLHECLYAHLLERARSVGRVRGLLWSQGESDAMTGTPQDGYGSRLNAFLDRLRRDLPDSDLHILVVQSAHLDKVEFERAFGWPLEIDLGWERVRRGQLESAHRPDTAVVAAGDLAVADGVHLDLPSVRRLGRRLAAAAVRMNGSSAILTPLPVRAEHVSARTIRLVVDGVRGTLRLSGRPEFHLRPAGPSVVGVEVIGHTLHLQLDRDCPADVALLFGPGSSRLASVVDDDDLALPAFGPLAVSNGTC